MARVLTWNLWWRFGDWRARRPAVLSVLRDARPDVVTLQEVWAGAPGEGVEAIAEAAGLEHWAYAPSPEAGRWLARTGETGVGIGNAVLSRWPIGRQVVHALPDVEGAGRGRVALYALVEHPDGALPVFTTHLTSPPDRSAVRCAQVASLAGFVAEQTPAGGHPPVVTGDLNAEPDSDEVRLLCGHKTAPAVPGQVLVDAWRYAEGSSAGETWDRRNPHVAATGSPSARIDYVLVGSPSDPVADPRGRVVSVRVVGDEPVGGVWPSDHSAVLVELGGPVRSDIA